MADTTHMRKIETQLINKPSMLLRRTLSAPATLYSENQEQESETLSMLNSGKDQTRLQMLVKPSMISCEVIKSKADVVVSKDGKGHYETVNDAVKAAPSNSKTRFVIYVKEGTYDEIVRITKSNITIVGDGRGKTVLTGRLSSLGGVGTYESATLAVEGAGFIGLCICIRNEAKREEKAAVALRVTGDMAALYRCGIKGFQDTLYAHKNRQFYCECYITGSWDFICGNGTALFQNCHIEVKESGSNKNIITAQQREKQNDTSGFIFQHCTIRESSKPTVKTYLGRPWGDCSRVVFMNCFMDELVNPAGWSHWEHESPQKEKEKESTVYYGEYNNTGLGAMKSGRVNWSGFKDIKDKKEAEKFTGEKMLFPDTWLKSTGIPYHGGLY